VSALALGLGFLKSELDFGLLGRWDFGKLDG
jgi:hypothetical protein